MIAAAIAEVVDHLVAAGIRATDDLRDLSTPGVLVEPPVVRYRFGRVVADADWTLIAAVAETGRRAELTALSDLVQAVHDAIGAIVDARPTGLVSNESGMPLPAYALTFSTTIGGTT